MVKMELPFGIKVSIPNYTRYLKNLEISGISGRKNKPENIEVHNGNEWYLTMSQVYTSAAKYTLGWYSHTYIPKKEEIPILIRAEQFLNAKPLATNLDQGIKMGYKDVITYFLRKNIEEMEKKVEKLVEDHGENEEGNRFQISRNIIEVLRVSLITVEETVEENDR